VVALKEINICQGNEIGPIMKGEFVMLRGQSGCGKTTLLNILGTIDQLTSGTISNNILCRTAWKADHQRLQGYGTLQDET
jgi:ABC-type lipoprotein export system ATPase subunit